MDGDAGLIEVTAAAETAVCLWCEGEFEPRKGGSPQRFCQTKHRDAFHSAGRRFAERAVLSGRLTVAELRGDPLEACMLRAGEQSHGEVRQLVAAAEVALEESELTEARRGNARNMVLAIPINAGGAIELCMLGWLDPKDLRDNKAAADAVVDLTNAAIAERLRPSA
jgi:hypothetical protein